MDTKVNLKCTISQRIDLVWDCFTQSKHIKNWNFAATSWHCPEAESDLVVGGDFCYTMAAKDNSMQFDFKGKFTEIIPKDKIAYQLEDKRRVEIYFSSDDQNTIVQQLFDVELSHSIAQQKKGRNAILQNFQLYCEQTQ